MLLDIIYRDSSLIAIDKPSGLIVHRSILSSDRISVLSCLRNQIGQRVFPIHRLDRATSGVLLFALTSEMAHRMCELFASRSVSKNYIAVVRGYTREFEDINYPLRENPLASTADARTAIHRLDTVELPYPVGRYNTARYSLLRAITQTGRRHQIRRHLAHIRHPIVGDTVHGDGRHNQFFRERFECNRLILHAAETSFVHPLTADRLVIRSPLSPELNVLFQRIGWEQHYDCFIGT